MCERRMSYQCLTSFGRRRPYCLVSTPKICGEQRSSISCVYGTDFKETLLKAKNAYGDKEIKKTASYK